MAAAGPAKTEVLSLFRAFLRTARQFSDYNIREYTRRRAADAFRENRALAHAPAAAGAFADGKQQLEVAKRQVLVYSLYAPKAKSVVEMKIQQFSDYNIREYTRRRAADAFRENRALADAPAAAAAFADGKQQLEVAKRQVLVYSLYAPKAKSVVEMKIHVAIFGYYYIPLAFVRYSILVVLAMIKCVEEILRVY
uniref:Complex 1 LYR protein domain-containing protein n=1 Tax=Aegilops tauschii TaxID=37682 RepID=R7W270_AEGTA